MLINLKNLADHKLDATDGHIGHVKDFYFDDRKWVIRYLVVDTGLWLPGRLVLLSPHSISEPTPGEKLIKVDLTRKQIEESPSIEQHRPVSRQFEEAYYNYYGWPTYWEGGAMWGMTDFPILAVPPVGFGGVHHGSGHHHEDIHLRSTVELDRYEIHTLDGHLGLVTGFMIDTKSWSITDLVVETGHWYSGKEILIPVGNVERISFEESAVFVNLTKGELTATPENEIAKARL